MVWLFPIVGALIGYLTNQLAIVMIFRPYTEKKFLGFSIPFTPGLIPKDRHILAERIAVVVTSHLLTHEEFAKIFEKAHFKEKFISKMNEILERFIGAAIMLIPENVKSKIEDAVYTSITKEIPDIVNKMDLHKVIEDKINDFPIERLEKIILEVSRKQLRAIAYLGGVIGFFIGLAQILLMHFSK